MDCGKRTIRVAIGKKLYWLEMKQDVKHFMRTFLLSVKAQNPYIKRSMGYINLYRF
jgi:hypothetical protein